MNSLKVEPLTTATPKANTDTKVAAPKFLRSSSKLRVFAGKRLVKRKDRLRIHNRISSANKRPGRGETLRKKFRRSLKMSKLQGELNDYTYIPEEDMISKLKYFYEPYNPVKGFRKYMYLVDAGTSEVKNSEELWE